MPLLVPSPGDDINGGGGMVESWDDGNGGDGGSV